ncbi:hypothetical protein CR513_29003, partial [Mucuna pruriens]
MGKHEEPGEEHEKDIEHVKVKVLQRLMTKERLERLEEEMQQKIGLFMGQGGSTQDLILFTLASTLHKMLQLKLNPWNLQAIGRAIQASYETYEEIGGKVGETSRGLESMRINTQSFNVKIDAFSKGIGKNHSVSIHESEGSHHEGPNSPSSRSFRSYRSVRSERHGRPRRVTRHKEEPKRGPLKGLNCKIPQFLGDNKSKVGYLGVWRNQLTYDTRAMKRAPTKSWHELRREMRDKCVPTSNDRDMHNKFQSLYQRFKSLEEYFKETKVVLVRAQVLEFEEATMARFLHNLNRNVQDIVKLYHYTSLANLVHQSTKIELQLKRHQAAKKSYLGSSWKDKDKKRERPRKDKSPKKGNVPSQDRKEEVTPPSLSSSRSSNIKCF